MTFENKYKNIKEIASEEIKFIENFMIQSVDVREPLKSHIINFLTAPSKRIRPLLSVLLYKSLYGKISENQLKALGAVELIHSASLIHDDIIDQSDTRRGLKTTAKEFGNKLGVICGDYLLSVAMKIITDLGSVKLLQNFSNTLNKMCIGEINQNFDRFKIGTIEDYIEKSKNKTAYLFETALLTPFLCYSKSYDDEILRGKIFRHSEQSVKSENFAPKNDVMEFESLQSASNFGLNVGIAFQIRDDLLNLIKTDFSKPTKNDIADGIYNAPVIYAGSVENYDDGVEKTRDLLNNYINHAFHALEELPDNEYKKGLRRFLELLGYD